MAADYLKRLGEIPSCIPSPDPGGASLRDWLRSINQKANRNFGTSDDSFSKSDYEFSLQQPWGKSLLHPSQGRLDYAAFSATITTYIEKHRVSDSCLQSACRERGGKVLQKKEGWRCIEQPKKPPPKRRVAKGPGRINVASKAPWWAPNAPASPLASSPEPATVVNPASLESLLRSAKEAKTSLLSKEHEIRFSQMEGMIAATAAQQRKKRKQGGPRGGGGVDLVFAVDVSGSMGVNIHDIILRIPSILSHLKAKEAGEIRVGIVTFENKDDIRVLLPLTSARDEAKVKGLLRSGLVSGGWGVEPVGLGTLAALQLFDAQPTRKQVVVLTDDDGMTDDLSHSKVFSDAAAAAKKAEVKLNLIRF